MTNVRTDHLTQQAVTMLNDVVVSQDFRERPQQRAMTESLVGNMVDGGQLMLEAPTGTGKTLAYLCGAVAVAQAASKKLVIATGTINLQQQLLNNDLPLITENAGVPLMIAAAKGRGNYACLLRVNALCVEGENNQQQVLGLDNIVPFDVAQRRQIPEKLLERFEIDGWDGDLETWPDQLDSKFLQVIVSTRESCTGRKCEHYRQCGFQQMRKDVHRADVIVANHALLLSDLELGSGVVLPPKDETLYVIDEAHDFPRKAVIHSRRQFDFTQIDEILSNMQKFQRPLDRYYKNIPQCKHADIKQAQVLISEIKLTLKNNGLIEVLSRKRYGQGRPDIRILKGTDVFLYLLERGKSLSEYLTGFHKILVQQSERIIEAGELTDGEEGEQSNAHFHAHMLMQCGHLSRLISSSNECWQLFLRDDPVDGPVYSRWLSLAKQGSTEPVLCCSHTWADEYLHEMLWEKAWGAVLVSATIQALGHFDYMRSLTGLQDPVPAISFESGFDYPQQAVLSVPWMEHTPASGDSKYFKEISRILPALLLPGEGALVLFTSRVALESVFNAIPDGLRGAVIAQGHQMSRSEMLAQHAERVSKGQRSVIFGLSSFAEGVDLPGDLCRHVVITRLPFPLFDSTLARNLKDWMGNRYFPDFSLPSASIRLIQACGRLLRNESDKGKITVLDRRLVLKNYGHDLLNALPAYSRKVEHSALPTIVPAPSNQESGGVLVF